MQSRRYETSACNFNGVSTKKFTVDSDITYLRLFFPLDNNNNTNKTASYT